MKTFILVFGFLVVQNSSAFATGLTCSAAFAKTEISVSKPVAASVTVRTGEVFTQGDRDAFIQRAKRGDVDPKEGRDALVTAETLSRRFKEPVVGPGLRTCYMKFGRVAVSTVHKLLISARDAMNPRQAKSKIVEAYSRLFEMKPKDAERRVCALASAGLPGTPDCGIFGQAIAKQCD